MKKPDSVVIVPSSVDTFFKDWLNFLVPFHNLTDREMDVASAFIKLRYELGKAISNNDILDEVVMNDDSKRKIRESCNITPSHFQVVLSKLRKSGFINDNRINPRYIPNIDPEANSFTTMLLFKL